MSVLDGPRRDPPHPGRWQSAMGQPSDDGSELVLMDGRRVPEASATYLPRATRRRSCASTSTTTRGAWSSGPHR